MSLASAAGGVGSGSARTLSQAQETCDEEGLKMVHLLPWPAR